MPEVYLIAMVIILALLFDFINGFHDTANAIATSVATRALSPRVAIIMSACMNFIGAMVSTGVAKTIGGEIVTSPHMIDSVVIVAALAAAIVWNLFTWWIGMPSSSSHAMIGGIIGAVIISYGAGAVHVAGVMNIVIGLVVSPLVALFTGYAIMTILYILFRNVGKSRVNMISQKVQILSAAMIAFSHGSNDAQKSMGIITLALLSGGFIGQLEVPWEVKIACALAMCMGTSVGGWRIIRTVGNKIFRMQPVNGFAADLNSSLIIFSATMLHLPVSTTHVVTGSIMGVGWATRFRAVRWNVAYQMVSAWFMTIPCTAAVGALVYLLIKNIF
jgi:PiT family inorganic phosphate transporter